MTCRACEEARRAALAVYDRMAAAIRGPRMKREEQRARDLDWRNWGVRVDTPPPTFFKLRGPSNTREPYTQAEIDAIRRKINRRR
jgi:hypothetical protein